MYYLVVSVYLLYQKKKNQDKNLYGFLINLDINTRKEDKCEYSINNLNILKFLIKIIIIIIIIIIKYFASNLHSKNK